jgi:hypothetical protein
MYAEEYVRRLDFFQVDHELAHRAVGDYTLGVDEPLRRLKVPPTGLTEAPKMLIQRDSVLPHARVHDARVLLHDAQRLISRDIRRHSTRSFFFLSFRHHRHSRSRRRLLDRHSRSRRRLLARCLVERIQICRQQPSSPAPAGAALFGKPPPQPQPQTLYSPCRRCS